MRDFFAPCCMTMMIDESEDDELANGNKDSISYGSFIKSWKSYSIISKEKKGKKYLSLKNYFNNNNNN